jgi:hypothetical protein
MKPELEQWRHVSDPLADGVINDIGMLSFHKKDPLFLLELVDTESSKAFKEQAYSVPKWIDTGTTNRSHEIAYHWRLYWRFYRNSVIVGYKVAIESPIQSQSPQYTVCATNL